MAKNAVQQALSELGPGESWNMLQNRVNKPKLKKSAQTILDNRVPGIVSQDSMGALPEMEPVGPGQLDPNLEYDPRDGFRKKQNFGGDYSALQMPPQKKAMTSEVINQLHQLWQSMSPDEQGQYGDFVRFMTEMEGEL